MVLYTTTAIITDLPENLTYIIDNQYVDTGAYSATELKKRDVSWLFEVPTWIQTTLF